MKKISVALIALMTVSLSGAFAADYYWRGVNTADLYTYLSGLGSPPFTLPPYTNANTEDDGSGYKLWKTGGVPGGVPGANDLAYFDFNTSQTSVWSQNVNNIIVDGAFAVNAIWMRADASNEPWRDENAHVQIQKNLALDHVSFNFGYTSAGGGVGNLKVTAGNTLTLNGTEPVRFVTGSNKRAGWHTFDIQTGAALVFNGATQTFNTYGGTESRMLGSGPVTFSNSTATINLGAAGTSTAPTMYFNTQLITVDPGQTWNADPTSRISVVALPGTSPNPGQYIINSATGGRLDNLDTVNIEVTRSSSTNTNATIAPRLMGGEYGSLKLSGGTSSHRTHHVYMTGAVTLKGNTVYAPGGGNPTTTTEYGLEIVNGGGNILTDWWLVTDGNDLQVDNGVRLLDNGNAGTAKTAYLWAASGNVTIGGDLRYDSTNNKPDATAPTRAVGLIGGDATVINLGGNFTTTVRSRNGNLWNLSTVNLIGGDDVKTFEVGDAATLTGVQSASYSIGTMNIGDGTTAGNVQLVNEYLNDNPFVSDVATDKLGEKLIVGTLNIKAGSTLDVNGLNVEVGPTTLDIAGDAWLDLNTGLTLSYQQRIETFVGLTDQTATWAGFQSRVKDSTNPGYTFEPTLYDGNTYWMAIPEPNVIGLLGLSLFAILARRRRR